MADKEALAEVPNLSPMRRQISMCIDETIGTRDFVAETIVAASGSFSAPTTCTSLANMHVSFLFKYKA